MKNLIILSFLVLASFIVKAQTITSITPNGEQEISIFNNRIPVSATLDQTAYAVGFAIDPVGPTKVLKGKNNNAGAAVTFPSSRGDYKYYEITIILNCELAPGEHTLRVDVYGANFRDLVDSREVTFTVQ
jgi:hypothetical protein